MRALSSPFLTPLAVTCLSVFAPGCKPSATKTTVGALDADRYSAENSDGTHLDCYVFGGDGNQPVRLCGDARALPGGAVYFSAVSAPADSRFVSSVGEPLTAGYYLLKSLGSNRIDAWALGQPPLREWIGDGKRLVAVETGADHHTRVRLIDPNGRSIHSESVLDAGITKSRSFLILRAPGDVAVLLIAKLGGEEMLLVRDPMGNADLTMADTSESGDAPAEGTKAWIARAAEARKNGGTFKPGEGELGSISWKGGDPLYQGAPLGPFHVPSTK